MILWASSRAVRALAYCAEDPQFETHFVKGWMLAHCPPSSEWGPGGYTGEIKATRKVTGHLTHKADGQDKRPL